MNLLSKAARKEKKGEASISCWSRPDTERQDVVDCGTKEAQMADSSEAAKCVMGCATKMMGATYTVSVRWKPTEI